MLDTLLNALGPLEKIAGTVKPPLRGNVVYLAYNDFDRVADEFHGRVLFIPPPSPRRYLAKVELTNRCDQPTYVKGAVLTLNGTRRYENKGKPVRLDPHEIRTEPFIFPVERSDTPLDAADFVLEVVPSVGRRTRLRGRLPVALD